LDILIEDPAGLSIGLVNIQHTSVRKKTVERQNASAINLNPRIPVAMRPAKRWMVSEELLAEDIGEEKLIVTAEKYQVSQIELYAEESCRLVFHSLDSYSETFRAHDRR